MVRADPYAGMPSGTWIRRTILTAPFTPSGQGSFYPHPLASFIRLRMAGGGAAGGGAASTSTNVAIGGGGGAGAYIDIGFTVRAQDLGISFPPFGGYLYQIGAAGAPGTAGANVGGSGGNTGWFFNAGVITAGGGTGGNGGASGTLLILGGAGGTTSNTYTGPLIELPLLIVGQVGYNGVAMSAAAVPAIGGNGGNTIFGGGGFSTVANSSQAGNSIGSTGYGGGGAGAANSGTQSAAAGGPGLPGVIIVDEFA